MTALCVCEDQIIRVGHLYPRPCSAAQIPPGSVLTAANVAKGEGIPSLTISKHLKDPINEVLLESACAPYGDSHLCGIVEYFGVLVAFF